jgi:hypothetical protein
VSAGEPTIDAVPVAARPAPRRLEASVRAACEGDSEALGTLTLALAEAERRAVAAERDLAFLARDRDGSLRAAQQRVDALASELQAVSADSERRDAALRALRDRCERVHARLPEIERTARSALRRAEREREELVARLAEQQRVQRVVAEQLEAQRGSLRLVAERLSAERAAARQRLVQMHEQAATAIRSAGQRAEAALGAAREIVEQLADPAAVEPPLRARLAAAERERDDLRRRLEGELEHARTAQGARDRRRGAEVEHLRREKLELGQRLLEELDEATNEKLELRARLGLAEHTLAQRDRELAGERKLADDAAMWASRVECELVGRSSATAGGRVVAAVPDVPGASRLAGVGGGSGVGGPAGVCGVGGGSGVGKPEGRSGVAAVPADCAVEVAPEAPVSLERRRGLRLRLRRVG